MSELEIRKNSFEEYWLEGDHWTVQDGKGLFALFETKEDAELFVSAKKKQEQLTPYLEALGKALKDIRTTLKMDGFDE